MKRILALCSVLITLGACGIGAWAAARPPLTIFIVPNATDIQVVSQGWGAWQIRYYAPGSPTTWYMDVAKQLEAQHWSSPVYEYGALSRTYSRASSFWFGELWEWAYLTFDPLRPHGAQITVRRALSISWWRRLSENRHTPPLAPRNFELSSLNS